MLNCRGGGKRRIAGKVRSTGTPELTIASGGDERIRLLDGMQGGTAGEAVIEGGVEMIEAQHSLIAKLIRDSHL